MRKFLIFKVAFVGILLSFSYPSFSKPLDILEKPQRSMVSIDIKIPVTIYYPFLKNTWKSTGVVVNRKKGIILTVFPFGTRVISSYKVRFFNGTETSAELLYRDPWIEGLSLIRATPNTVPQDVCEIHFAKSSMTMNQEIFILDSDTNNNFVIKNGIVSDLYSIGGSSMPCQLITLSMDMPISSNASPVLNNKGEFIGLKCQGESTHARALHPKYIRHIMKFIDANKKPTRKHIGIITNIYSLGQACKTRSFPKKELRFYTKKFKNSRLQAIEVISTLKGSPAETITYGLIKQATSTKNNKKLDSNTLTFSKQNVLQNGDIIWSIDGKEIGPNLVDFDMAMNNSKKNTIKVGVFRSFRVKEKIKWKKKEFDIKLYDLGTYSINSIIKFGRYILFEADEIFAYKYSVPLKSLILKELAFGLSYIHGNYMLISNITHVKKVNGNVVKNISDFLQLIPKLKKKKHFVIQGHFYDIYGSRSNIENLKVNMSLNNDCVFKNHIFDSKSMTWKVNNIPVID